MPRPTHALVVLPLVLFAVAPSARIAAQPPLNVALGDPGKLPVGEDGRPLNLDFERGNLDDWTPQGAAFEQQPIQGPISKNRPFGDGKQSDHTGDYWLGGYEKLRDEPIGTLVSKPFVASAPFATFLVGGGSHPETRVEIVRASDNKVLFTARGRNEENMRPVLVDLREVQGAAIFVRVVDEHTGGWGHVNFDDFRLHAQEPRFSTQLVKPPPPVEALYPFAGLDPAEAAQSMRTPEGFHVVLGASEPAVQQPIALAIDDRGRLWVAEALTYPVRAPEGEGKDRILIFEDTDGDGTLDKRTVFIEGLNLVSGLEVGFGGVWVGAAPYLLFIADKDGDDRPDGEPQVLLDGWAYQDTHETLNAFNWGPDGWLYGCHGVFTHSRVGKPGTPDEQRIPINAGIWRYHPLRHQFEVFAHGTSNPWGVDFDDWGQAFCTACVIPHLFHIIQGARYERQAGQHFNPHTYDDIKTIADHRHYTGNQWNNDDRRSSDELGGGHAHAGAMVYLGGTWPAAYRNQLFMHNIHGNRVNIDLPEAVGSGYVGHHGPDFLLTRDQWSQMLTLHYGPDGNVWMIDWYDANQCHRREEEVHDRSNGRIFKVVYGETRAEPVDLAKRSDLELVELQLAENDWFVRHARRLLQERAAAGAIDAAARARLVELAQATDLPLPRRLRAVWALHVSGGVPTAVAQRLLEESTPHLQAWTVQLLTETPPAADGVGLADDELGARLAGLATSSSAVVRLYVASALQRVPVERRWAILEPLLHHPEDATDHNLPLMYWYAAEPLADLDPARALALAASAGAIHPRLQEFMIRKIGSSQGQPLDLLIGGLAKAATDGERRTFLRGIDQALRGQRLVEPPALWAELYAKLRESEDRELQLLSTVLAARLGNREAAQLVLGFTGDANQPAEERRRSLASALELRLDGVIPLLQQLLSDAALRGDALRGLAAFDDEATPDRLLAVFPGLNEEEQRGAVATLASRAPYAQRLLDAVQHGTVPRALLTADLVRQLQNLEDDALTQRIASVWGIVRVSDADRKALIEQHKELVAAPLAPADIELGRAVFARTCSQCHTLFGTGGKVGPDLTGANRSSIDYLLTNILDPSAVMAKDYQPTVIRLDTGRVITGIVRERTDRTWTVRTADDTLLVNVDEIEQSKVSDRSMMPDDLLRPLGLHERRSLVAYLQSPGQTPRLADAQAAANIFNGRDLSGWVGNPELWTVEEGELVGQTAGLDHNEFLVSELSAGDFRLSLEVKLVDNAGNSGVQFRSRPRADGSVEGYQADIGAGWWGKLYEEHGRALLWDKSGESHVQLGEWNKYEILAVGSRVRTWINGNLCVDLEDPAGMRRGVIALQLHSGGATEVRFRNLTLKLLDPPRDGFAPRASRALTDGEQITWRRYQLDNVFRSEGVAVGDLNADGELDVVAGNAWYEAPEWTPRPLRARLESFDINGYSDSFCNFTDDLDGDGLSDVLVVDFPGKQTWWHRNPGVAGGVWERHEAVPVTNNESPQYGDLDGDGRAELIHGAEGKRMIASTPGANPLAPWRQTPISGGDSPGTDRFSHGLGIGDLNQDQRLDVLVPQGWWAGTPSGSEVRGGEFRPSPLGGAAAQMHVLDVDGDGDMDVISSSAHNYGIWWHERDGDTFKLHEIDRTFSQTHSLCVADINGDGLPDLVTGKRYWAHNGHDPGANEPAVLHWFELARTAEGPTWTKHTIDDDSGVGTQFVVEDVDRDGLLDIVTANKKGVFLFLQRRE